MKKIDKVTVVIYSKKQEIVNLHFIANFQNLFNLQTGEKI